MKSAYLLIAHGSKEKQSNQDFLSFVEKLSRSQPERVFQQAFLELAKPSIPEAIDLCVKNGAEQVFVIPFMLFSGRHVKEDVPHFIQEAKAKHPAIDFHYSSPLAESPEMLELVAQKIKSFERKKKDE
jgi:sirohydrochlorin cobaltochelatase